MQKNIYLFLFLLLGFPLLMNAQSCPNLAVQKTYTQRLELTGVAITSKIMDPSNPLPRSNQNKIDGTYSNGGFKVLVLEREGDLYKVANSDLGRTMMVRSPGLELEENNYYSLVMRKFRRESQPMANSAENGQAVDWEVISGSLR